MTYKQQSTQCTRRGAHGAWWCLGIVVAICAAACAPPPDPTHRSVDYYRANKESRDAKVAECSNDPGGLGKTPDCVNAIQAAQIEDVGSLRDLPPLNLPSETRSNDSSQRADEANAPEIRDGAGSPPAQ